MSSLLALQTKDTIVFASDTALSFEHNNKVFRVGNNEKKIFEYQNFIMFASGKKHLRDLFIQNIGLSPTIDTIESVLNGIIKPLSSEYSLEIVIGLKDLSKIIFFSSVDGFKYKENICNDNNTHLFSAGFKTNEIADKFIEEFEINDLNNALINTYKAFSCEQIGGNLDVFILKNNKITFNSFPIDNLKSFSDTEIIEKLTSLVHADKLVGRMLIGNKLHIETDTGIISLEGSKQSIYDASGTERVTLGQYDLNGTTKYGLKIDSGSIDIVGGLDESHISSSLVNKWNQMEENAKTHANDLNTSLRNDLRITSALPTSISLDSSGITAYTSNSSNYARLDHRGLYIQGGAIDIRTSSSNNRGVVFDGNGIRGYNSSGTKTFEIDTNGNAMFGGSLDNADGTFKGLVTGALSASTISAIEINASQIKSGTISANLLNANTIRSKVIQAGGLSADYITSGTINSVTINSVTINSANIDITESISIGKGVYMRGNGTGIYFDTWSQIYDYSGNMTIEAFNDINYYGKRHYFNGEVNFSNAVVSGITVNRATYATYANYLNGYSSSDFALGHTSGIGIAYSSGARRLYVRLYGSDVGWVQLNTG